MRKNKAGIFRRTLMACLCLCCILTLAPARGEIQVEIAADDWSWEEGSVATFYGSVLSDQDVKDAVMTLSAETRLEDSGEVLFTAVNEKKLKIRKRSAEISEDLKSGEAWTFEGEWALPGDTGEGLAWASIRLTVRDADGKELVTGILEEGSRAEDENAASASPVRRADRIILVLALACAFVWMLAVGRYLLLNRKIKVKG